MELSTMALEIRGIWIVHPTLGKKLDVHPDALEGSETP